MKKPVGFDSPAGLLILSADAAVIVEWSPRRVEQLRRLELGLADATEHELVAAKR